MRFLVLFFALFSHLAWAQLFSIDQRANVDVVRYFDETQSLHAKFKQWMARNNGALEESEGEVWIVKPNRFFWDYQRPYAQQIVGNESRVWHYDIDLEQISVRPREEMIGDVAMRLLAGEEKIEDLFVIERVASHEAPALIASLGESFYRLQPREESEFAEALFLAFDAGELRGIYSDLSSEALALEFLDLQRNTAIDAKMFEFVAPAGVDVIGE